MTTPIKRILKQGTQEWLDWRRNGVTATEAAAAIGSSKWATALSVYKAKLNPDSVKPVDNKYVEWGSRLEDVIKFGKFAEQHKEFNVVQGECYEHPVYPWARCSLDGELVHRGCCEAILEVKTGSNISDWDPVPPGYYDQAQWQMFVTGVKKVYFAVLINGRDYFERVVVANEQRQYELFLAAENLWNAIKLKTPPEPKDPVLDADAAIANAVKSKDKDPVEVGDELMKEWSTWSERLKEAETEVKRIKFEFTRLLDKGGSLTYEGRPFAKMVTRRGTETLDSKKLKEQFPVIWNACVKPGKDTTYLKVW